MNENANHVSRVADTPSPKAESFGTRHRRSFAISMIIGAIMAVLAPLQTDNIPFLPRLAYWEILMISGATIGLGVTEIIERWGRLRSLPWVEIPLSGVLIALPLTMIVMSAGSMFFGAGASGAMRFSYNFAITALISTAITALMHLVDQKGEAAALADMPTRRETDSVVASPESLSLDADQNRFAQRLPLHLRALSIQALQAEDHYLRVHFADGQSTLILMRLSDAVAELPAERGAQTHRSWWVAKEALRRVTKSDGRAMLTLEHDVEAPVSRSFYKALGDKGWLS